MDETQAQAAFEQWWHRWLPEDNEPSIVAIDKRSAKDAWLACYQHLAPQITDAYDLGWLRCVEWSGRDDLAADLQSTAYLNKRTNTLKALAEKAAREQEKKTC
ncbi:hypothetical protein [Ralstonia solanacearum]|uniref:hypothetical protein n=1 Tax=Ralstonia solanacearum TaxID=305 RepID=UPI003D801777